MGVQRADPLYPVNSTTVDSGTGIDIRLLDSAQAGATDSDQSARWTHTQDGQNRTFDPDTALVTANNNPTSFQGEGWALRLSEDHTPADDTNCNTFLKDGTHTVQMRTLMNANGGTNLGGTATFTMKAAFFRYNVSSNTGVFIASGTASQSWNTTALGDNNTRKNTSISVTVSSDEEFGVNEILLLQLGASGDSLPNATLGTTNYDLTLDVDDADTFINFAGSLGGIAIMCALTNTIDGRGTADPPLKQLAMARSADGRGASSVVKAAQVAKEFTLDGRGTTSHIKAVEKDDFDLVGMGEPTFDRVTVAAKSFTVEGQGTASLVNRAVELERTADGRGDLTLERETIAAKVFTVNGEGIVTEIHPVQAFRTFSLVGVGEFLVEGPNTSTICMPIDEVPTGEGGGEPPVEIKKFYPIFDE